VAGLRAQFIEEERARTLAYLRVRRRRPFYPACTRWKDRAIAPVIYHVPRFWELTQEKTSGNACAAVTLRKTYRLEPEPPE
jgi:hypothetical protein